MLSKIENFAENDKYKIINYNYSNTLGLTIYQTSKYSLVWHLKI